MFFSSINPTKHLGLPLLAATVVVGGVAATAPAQAMEITNKYSVTTAYKPGTNQNGAGHAAWSLLGRSYVTTSAKDLFWEEYDDGTARFYGTIFDRQNVDNGNLDTFGWNVDVHLTKRDGAGWGGHKRELGGNNYVDRGGSVDPSTWSFFDFSDDIASTLTGFGGSNDGRMLVIDDLTNGKYPVQVGFGANGKNTNFGMSTWFNMKEDGVIVDNHADFNVDLTPVPTPATGLAWLVTSGAAIARKRKQSRES